MRIRLPHPRAASVVPNPMQLQDLPAIDMMGTTTTARRYDSSTKTVYRWLDQGLPFFQSSPRSKILIRPDDVETFLQRRCHAQVDVNVMVEDLAKELTDAAHNAPDRPAAHIRRKHQDDAAV